jgi:parallel beta-helix repeat protein
MMVVATVALAWTATVAEARTIRVPGDYPSLAEAAEAAQSGDRIVVAEGASGVNVEIRGKSRLSIVGAGDPVLDGGGSGVVLTIRDSKRITVSGLVLANAGTDGLRVYDSSRVVIRDCEIRDSNRMGVYVGNVEHVKLQQNVIDGAGFHGIWLTLNVGKAPASALKILRNVVRNCGQDGIQLAGGGHSVTKNDVSECGQYGIQLSKSDASKVIGNEVRDVGNGGIWVDGEKNRVDRNHVQNTEDDGIGIYGDRNRASKNLIEDAKDDGIELERGTGNKLVKNEVRNSGEHGIALFDAAGNKILRNDVLGSGALWGGVDLKDYSGADANKWKKNQYETDDFST